jgi:exopolysaccharide biosynthesis protein
MADLGAGHAVMLDGGGSSAMWIENRGVVNTQSDPGRRVGNQIAIFGR